MHIGIDIDGTIAGHNRKAFTVACNEAFGLGLTEQSLSRTSIMAHPKMLALQQNRENYFQDTITRIEQSPETLISLPPLQGASSGVQRLAEYGSVTYYTVRKAHSTSTPEAVERATKQWLHTHQFPCSEHVTFCMSIMNKLLKIYQRLRTQPEPCLLIDDLAPALLVAFAQLQAGDHPRFSDLECTHITGLLQTYLTLVAFGGSPLTATSGLQVAHLSSWGAVDELITQNLVEGIAHVH